MSDVEELIAGAGPIGLTAAIELARRGIGCRIVDPLLEPPQYAKAVGVQPRTLEVFEGMGVLRRILDASTPMRGQQVWVNGAKVGELELPLPADVPFGFILIPQYETERILAEELTLRGVTIERGIRLSGFEQDAGEFTATLTGTLLLYAGEDLDADTVASLESTAPAAGGDFAATYFATHGAAYAIRPDGYLGFATSDLDVSALLTHLAATFG